jgi:HEAT repeat protein
MVLFLMAMAVAVAGQADDAAADEAIAAYDMAFTKARDGGTRATLVTTLAQTQHEKVIPKLGSALTHADKEVRVAAANGLRGYSSAAPALKKAATKALVDATPLSINAKDFEVREAFLSAMGALQDDAALPYIKKSLEDKTLRISSAAVTAAVALRSKDVIDPLIDLLRESEDTMKKASNPAFKGKKPTSTAKKDGPPDEEELKVDRAGHLVPAIQSSLESLTGQKQPDAGSWRLWWSRARATFVLKKE